MGKIGVNLSIDVKAIDKERLVYHTNGKAYLNMTVFIDPASTSQYGDHGIINQSVSKEERAQNIDGKILGNAKIFWTEGEQQQQYQAAAQQPPQQRAAQHPMNQPAAMQQPAAPQHQMVGQPQLPSSPQGINQPQQMANQQGPAPQGFDANRTPGSIVAAAPPQQQQPAQGFDNFDDDIPF